MEEQGTEDDTPIEDTVFESNGLPLEEENDFLDNSEEEDDVGNAL